MGACPCGASIQFLLFWSQEPHLLSVPAPAHPRPFARAVSLARFILSSAEEKDLVNPAILLGVKERLFLVKNVCTTCHRAPEPGQSTHACFRPLFTSHLRTSWGKGSHLAESKTSGVKEICSSYSTSKSPRSYTTDVNENADSPSEPVSSCESLSLTHCAL